MSDIKLTGEKRKDVSEVAGEHFKLGEYMKNTFDMFGGVTEKVSLLCDNSLINAVVDRFGEEVLIRKNDENSFVVTVSANVSPTFYAWVFTFGGKMKIDSPKKIADEFFKKYHADSLFTLTKTQEIGNIYIFDYTRSVENIPTAECISIWTNLEGKFVGYSKCLLDELDKEYDFSKVDLSAATQTIYQKLDTMSTVVKEKYDEIKYAEPSYTLTVLKDGRLALYCEASVEIITNITEDVQNISGSLFTFIIPLEATTP